MLSIIPCFKISQIRCNCIIVRGRGRNRSESHSVRFEKLSKVWKISHKISVFTIKWVTSVSHILWKAFVLIFCLLMKCLFEIILYEWSLTSCWGIFYFRVSELWQNFVGPQWKLFPTSLTHIDTQATKVAAKGWIVGAIILQNMHISKHHNYI